MTILHKSRSPSSVPRLKLPKDLFVDIALSFGSEINRELDYLQNISCGGNLKQLLVVSLNLGLFNYACVHMA